jgi:putative sigma-54 modulation protein
MQLTITFQNMTHSNELEAHAHEKYTKIVDFLASETILSADLWLKADKHNTHHAVEMHIKTTHMALNAHDQGIDMYVAIDNTMDKMLRQIKKHKERSIDKMHKFDSEKRKFNR